MINFEANILVAYVWDGDIGSKTNVSIRNWIRIYFLTLCDSSQPAVLLVGYDYTSNNSVDTEGSSQTLNGQHDSYSRKSYITSIGVSRYRWVNFTQLAVIRSCLIFVYRRLSESFLFHRCEPCSDHCVALPVAILLSLHVQLNLLIPTNRPHSLKH